MKKDTRDLGWALEIWHDAGPGYIIKSKNPKLYEIEKAKAEAEGRLIDDAIKRLKETQGYWLEDTFFTFEIEAYDDELDRIVCRWCGEHVVEWLQATGYTPIDYLMDEAGEGTFEIIRDFVGTERFWIKPTDFRKN